MTLDRGEAGIDGRLIQSIRKLANPAANRRDEAPLLELPSHYISSPPLTTPYLAPKGENLAGLKCDSI